MFKRKLDCLSVGFDYPNIPRAPRSCRVNDHVILILICYLKCHELLSDDSRLIFSEEGPKQEDR